MTINERQIYYALDKISYLASKGVTVSLSVKNDGSFDMTVNPHLLGMIDEDEDEDEEIDYIKDKESHQKIQYREFTKYLFDPLMKEIQDYGIAVNPHILRMIMEENQDDQK